MGQTLTKDKGLVLHVDRTFASGEIPAKRVVLGGGQIGETAAVPALPSVHMCDCDEAPTFFYDDGAPLALVAHTEHIPTQVRSRGRIVNARELAQAFIKAQSGQPVPAAAPVPAPVAAPAPTPGRLSGQSKLPPRGRGRVAATAPEPVPARRGGVTLKGSDILPAGLGGGAPARASAGAGLRDDDDA